LLPRLSARQPQDGVGGGGQAGVVGDEDDRVAGREPADHREQALGAGPAKSENMSKSRSLTIEATIQL
jgi:hypothetical protein